MDKNRIISIKETVVDILKAKLALYNSLIEDGIAFMPLTPFKANTALENVNASLENESDEDLNPQLDKRRTVLKAGSKH